MTLVFVTGLLAFLASCIWWGLSRREAIAAAAAGTSAKLAGGVGVVLIVLGLIQMIAGAVGILYLLAVLFVWAAYLGVGPLAVPALLFAGWGVVLGLRLVVRRTRGACRSAAFWYLPFSAFFAWACVFEYRHQNLQTVQLLVAAIAILVLFIFMVVPLLPSATMVPAKSVRRSA